MPDRPPHSYNGIGRSSLLETTALSDLGFIERHRNVWAARPELRSVYHQLFDQLSSAVISRRPVVELGAGPGFFKEYCPSLIATDVISTNWVDLLCDGCTMPFRGESIGAIVMLDVLHHLPRPLAFITEAARVLRPGGLVAMIEPWITPASYLLYRYFHHEDCKMHINIDDPFHSVGKKAFDGNATIPYNLVSHYSQASDSPLNLTHLQPFLALPYITSLGFKRTRSIPAGLISAATVCEKLLGPLGRLNATRALLVWEKHA